jgi:restriction system protein
MPKDLTMWMVRAGEDAYLIEDFLSKKVVAIGWDAVGNLANVVDLNTIKEKLRKGYPQSNDRQIYNFAGQLSRFRNEFAKGQLVLTYNPNERVYWVGEIVSDYQYNPTLFQLLPHIRNVVWKQSIPRDQLSTKSKNSLGSTQTVFKISPLTVDELLNGKVRTDDTEPQLSDEVEETLENIKEDFEAKANEFIKDKVSKLDWEEMQELVAGILRGMGYKTLVSPRGADRGKDIIASPDGLGLENPKIIAEVKHRQGAMGAPEVRSFLGGLRQNDRGVYVSTGGFTKEAKYEAERSIIPITLIDLDMLVLLIIQHYDNFDMDTRSLIPLKKIYWPLEN